MTESHPPPGQNTKTHLIVAGVLAVLAVIATVVAINIDLDVQPQEAVGDVEAVAKARAREDMVLARGVYYLPHDMPRQQADAVGKHLATMSVRVVRARPHEGVDAFTAAYNRAIAAHLVDEHGRGAVATLRKILSRRGGEVWHGGAMRVMTYNIRSFEGYAPEGKWDRCQDVIWGGQMMDRFVQEIRLHDPTVLCLQEVPSEAVIVRLAARLDMEYTHFKGGWKNKGWPEGISGAVLSKYPIVEAASHPSLNWTERPEDLFTRFWGRVVLKTPIGPVAVHAMHGYHKDSDVRLRELAEVLPVVKRDLETGHSVILLGDLNHKPDSQEYQRLQASGMTDSFAGRAGAGTLTSPSIGPKSRIDYIWSAGPLSAQLSDARVLFEGAFRTNPADELSFALSDHLPVMAVFSMSR